MKFFVFFPACHYRNFYGYFHDSKTLFCKSQMSVFATFMLTRVINFATFFYILIKKLPLDSQFLKYYRNFISSMTMRPWGDPYWGFWICLRKITWSKELNMNLMNLKGIQFKNKDWIEKKRSKIKIEYNNQKCD